MKAFALDDSIKIRRGKKMEGISSHFDHVTGRHVIGQQVLTLGLATEEALLHLNSQIYISQVKTRELINASMSFLSEAFSWKHLRCDWNVSNGENGAGFRHFEVLT